MRLDKFLCDTNKGTRSQVKEVIRKGLVTVNGAVEKDPGKKVVPEKDLVTFCGETVSYQQFYYFMLNKPAGVVSATRDDREKTVLDLIHCEDAKDLFPVGRLDKDTEGLLLLTNDGALAHYLLSPTRHVDKAYHAVIAHSLHPEQIRVLEQGVDIGDEKFTLPARVEVLEEKKICLTIHEGRFHQVKRMLQAVDNEVLALKRVSFGPLLLDEKLLPGESRQLSVEEVALLNEAANAIGKRCGDL